MSELARLAEEDPHELHIEEGLSQAVVSSIEQRLSLSAESTARQAPAEHLGPPLSLDGRSAVAPRLFEPIAIRDDLRTKKAATGSAPHLLGEHFEPKMTRQHFVPSP